MELGNHTSTHVDLHVVGLAAYERDILDCDRTLRPLLAKRDMQPRWFRPLSCVRAHADSRRRAGVIAGRISLARDGDQPDWIWAAATGGVGRAI